MKNIALLADGWRRFVTYSWVEGIMSGAKEMGVDICLYFFSTNGTWSRDQKFNSGEYSLYDLPDLENFDGIVFDCTNTTDEHQIDKIVNKLKNLSIPVVSIGYDIEGFYYVGNDNKKLFRQIVDHLHYDHGIENFVFAGGPDFHYENRMRYQAFLEAMDDYGIAVTDDMVLFGEFDYGTGVRYMNEWHESGKPLPQAFVCANDNIAAGICATAETLGYKVPRDFLVTGFDNLDKAAYFNPQITTVEHNRGNIGRFAVQILKDVWEGSMKATDHFLESEFIPAESCGCPNTYRVNYRDYIKESIKFSVKQERAEDDVMILQNRVEECADYDELFKEYSDYIQALSCDGVYIVVDRKLLTADIDSHFSTVGYDIENEVVVFANERGKGSIPIQTVQDMMRYMHDSKEPTCFMFCAIHFRNEIVGYTILKNPYFLYGRPELFDIQSTLTRKLENLFKQRVLENANLEMKKLYNRDSLTGLYNRIACNEMVVPLFDELTKNNIGCTLIFLDVDDFKLINDTYGHRYGDNMLRGIAHILDKERPSGAMVYRFGGDEFCVFIPGVDSILVDSYMNRVTDILSDKGICISHGTIYTDTHGHKSFDEYLARADKKMYSIKQDHKKKKQPWFKKGVDISSIPELVDAGVSFYDAEGVRRDIFDILKENNINSVRLRIWNEPGNVPESKGYCSLVYTLEMAHKIKKYGMHFVLDFHYSDYWADPGQQNKPKAWQHLSFEELKKAVYDYTYSVLNKLKMSDCAPDMVQIGNEIRSGMLFPDGEVPKYDQLTELVNCGIHAVRDVLPDADVMIHLDQGGRFYYLKEWFDAMFAAGMEPIDAIGISFYAFWHGTYMDLKYTMKKLIETYNLPVYVVETAHPWRQCEGEHVSREMMDTAGLPAGIREQKISLDMIMQAAAEVSANTTGKTGVYYWEPVCAPERGFGSWHENMGMFDTKCRELEGWKAYKDFDTQHLPIYDLDSFMESFYLTDGMEKVETGINILPNPDFFDGLDGWWISKNPDNVMLETNDEGLYISSDTNFDFEITRQIYIKQPGRYVLSVDYRGTNTTGVDVCLFMTEISADGQKEHTKKIFPSDIRYVTHSLEAVELSEGHINIGIRMHTPPVFAKIKQFSLVVI